MASVTVDVHARLVDRDIRKATFDVQRHMQQMGQDAGKTFSTNWAQGAERGSDRVVRAMDRSAAAVEKVTKAEERYHKALKSGDVEEIVSASNKLARIRRDLASQDQRLHSAMSGLAATMPSVAGGLTDAAGAAGEAAGTFGNLAGVAGKLGPSAAVAAPAIAGIGLAITSLVGVAAQASGVIGLLPGVVAGAASAFGTLKLGTQGLDDAFSNISDPVKFAESLRQLAPSAQQAMLAIQGMMPSLKELQQATQESLFKNVAPQLNQTVNELLPQIRQLTTGVAGGMNTALTGVMGQLQNPQTMAAVSATVDNIVRAFQNLGPAAAPFTQAMVQLSSVSSSFLPQLATAITNGANAFAHFIDEASRSGDLQKFIQGGIDAMSQLGPIALDVAKAFLSLAPVGEKVLPLIADTVHGIAEVMPTIATIVENFTPLFTLWEGSVVAVGTAFDVVKGAAEAVVPVVNKVTEAINAMLDPVRAAIDLANNLPGINIPNIPDIGQIGSGADVSLGGGANASRERRGLAPVAPTAGLPSFTGAALPSMQPGWGMPAPAGQGWNPAQQYRDHVSAINSGSGGGSSVSGYSSSSSNADRMMQLALSSDGAKYGAASDLANGLADCSGAISDLVEVLNSGTSSPQRLFTTTNFASDAQAAKLGFLPGYMPGALNVGVNPHPGNQGHMAATLPNGVNFESGGSGGGVRYGHGAAGALDSQFEKRYYRPVDGLTGGRSSGATPVTVQDFSSTAAQTMQGIGGDQSDSDMGLSQGLPGLVSYLFGQLATALTAPITSQLAARSTGPQGGYGAFGIQAQQNQALGRSPILGQPIGPVASTPFAPPASPFLPGASTAPGATPSVNPFGAPRAPGGAGMPGPAAQGYQSAYQPPNTGGGWQPSGGGGNGIGGAPLAAATAAASAFPGGGAAAQTGMQLINRTIGYGQQLAGIGVSGLLETFGLHDSALGDPNKSWIGRIAAGFAGAKPATPSTAGETKVPLKQADTQAGQQAQGAGLGAKGPATVNIENFTQAENRNAQQTVQDLAFRTAAQGNR